MYGSNSVIGRRPVQQDALCVGEPVVADTRIFAIFDGHGVTAGGQCSKLASIKIRKLLANNLNRPVPAEQESGVVGDALIKSFSQFDDYLRAGPEPEAEEVTLGKSKKKVSRWAKWFSSSRSSSDFGHSGSCACVLVETKNNFIFANLGDSRAILSDGKRITADQTPLSLSELNRIYAAGGWAVQGRLFGTIVPTRTFGNFNFKAVIKGDQPALSNVPEIHVIPRTPEMPKFVIIMCDGIHDVMKDKEIAKIAEDNAKLHPQAIATLITTEAFNRGSRDNLSCIVVRTDRETRIPKSSSLSSIDLTPSDSDCETSTEE